MSTDIHSCPLDGACPGGADFSAGQCGSGYAGATCANCADDHFLTGSKCKVCDSEDDGSTLLVVIIGVVLGTIAALLLVAHVFAYKLRTIVPARIGNRFSKTWRFLLMHKGHFLIKLKVAINVRQIVKQFGSTYGIPYPKVFVEVLDALAFIELDVFAPVRFNCLGVLAYIVLRYCLWVCTMSSTDVLQLTRSLV